ncbi:MAG TPA: hypothetical protein VMV56_05335 [Williamwhitmania sp.]|nr:hypothetical protein [Williamwhitmania sp.]
MQPDIREIDFIPLGNINISWKFLEKALQLNGFRLVLTDTLTSVVGLVNADKKFIPALIVPAEAALSAEQSEIAKLMQSRRLPYLNIPVLNDGSLGLVTIVVGTERLKQQRLEEALSIIRVFINVGQATSGSITSDFASEFLEGVSHEVRSFLNGISGPIQLLKDKIEAKDQYDLYSMIDSSIGRLVRFTFKTSLIGLLQKQKYGAKKEIVNLFPLLQQATVNLQEIKFSGSVNVLVEKPTFEPVVSGDADLLLQCFESLIERIVLSYGNEAPVSVSFSSPENGRFTCKIAFAGLRSVDEIGGMEQQLNRDFASDIGFILAKQIMELQAIEFKFVILADNQVEFLLIFNHHKV